MNKPKVIKIKTSPRKGKGQEVVMQKWEYLFIETSGGAAGYPLRVSSINGKPTGEMRPAGLIRSAKVIKEEPLAFEYFNKLGRVGWELAAKSGYYIFKRPLVE